MAYKKDYEISRLKELEFENYLKDKYGNKHGLLTEHTNSEEYFPYWDISTTATSHENRITRFEVKYNSNYVTTYEKDAIVIEACRIIDEQVHPTGLAITQADYYVLCFENDNNFYLLPILKLKELVATFKKVKKQVITDKKGFQLHIFDKEYLLQFCKVI